MERHGGFRGCCWMVKRRLKYHFASPDTRTRTRTRISFLFLFLLISQGVYQYNDCPFFLCLSSFISWIGIQASTGLILRGTDWEHRIHLHRLLLLLVGLHLLRWFDPRFQLFRPRSRRLAPL